MSLIMIEGFDDGLAIERAPSSGIVAADISATYGRNGAGLRVGDTPYNFYRRTINTTPTRILVGFAFYVVDVGGNNQQLLRVHSSNYYEVNLRDTDLAVGAFSQAAGDYWSSPNAFSMNTWHYLEASFYIANSGGFMQVKIDGSLVIDESGIDTLYGTALINDMLIAEGVDDVYIDDIYVKYGDTALTYLGDIEVVTLLPDGNGNSSGLVGSDSNSTDNYLLVDNNAAIPPATTEYVGSATEGDKDTYSMDDLAGTDDVIAVQTTLYASMTDTGPKYVRPVIRSGGTDYPGTSVPLLNSSYVPYDELWEEDPDTATAWTYGGVNSAEVGQEVRDS